MPEAETLPVGTEVGAGRFVISGILGSGAQADTFCAVDKQDGRVVALKRFAVRGASSWKDVELAEREAAVLEGLDHPLLPGYITHFEEEGVLYLALEKIEGRSLQNLSRRSQLTQQQVVLFLKDMAELFDYLHQLAPAVVHRDVKPGNVVLRPDGHYALVDFGSVSHCLKPEGGSTVVGTFGFMAPEQFQGRALPASDVYAAGATAVSLLCGVAPESLPHKGLRLDVAASLGASVAPSLVSLLQAMLEPDPEIRGKLPLSRLLEVHGVERAFGGSQASTQQPNNERGKPGREGAKASGEPFFGREVFEPELVQPRVELDLIRTGLNLPFVRLAVLLALLVARVALSVVLLVAVPMVLTVLSLAFGAELRQAARQVRAGGKQALAAVSGVRRRVNRTRARTPAQSASDLKSKRQARKARRKPKQQRVEEPGERQAERFKDELEEQAERFEEELESRAEEWERRWDEEHRDKRQ